MWVVVVVERERAGLQGNDSVAYGVDTGGVCVMRLCVGRKGWGRK